MLDFLLKEPGVSRIIAVDDQSSDRSYAIVTERAGRDNRLVLLQTAERSGQLAAWKIAAEHAETEDIVFIDADSRPAPGAISRLASTLSANRALAVVSGRVEPDAESARWPAARFRASILHRVRSLQHPKETIIGRFFAIRRHWFLATADRSDIIANDAFLGASARRQNLATEYVSGAVTRYCEAQSTYDFAAQRQRADAGYRQLRELGILRSSDEPKLIEYLGCFASAALRDPFGAFAWAREQLKARKLSAYRQSGKDEGAWEIQATTKRTLE